MEASEYLARYLDKLRVSCYCDNSGDVGVSTSSALPPGSLELTNHFPQEVEILTNPFSTLSIESDEEPKGYPDILSLWTVPIKRPKYVPNDFHHFIAQRIIPDFSDQRKTCYYQFAVVALLSESDFINIKQMGFFPSDLLGKPILDKNEALMPRDPASYRNYAVARTSNKYHSEEKLFGNCSELTDTPFNHLWRAYVECNHSYPKCIVIYSWNFPCSYCTDLIVESLEEKPYYNSVSVVLAYTAIWKRDNDQERSRKKLESNNITVKHVPYRHPAE